MSGRCGGVEGGRLFLELVRCPVSGVLCFCEGLSVSWV